MSYITPITRLRLPEPCRLTRSSPLTATIRDSLSLRPDARNYWGISSGEFLQDIFIDIKCTKGLLLLKIVLARNGSKLFGFFITTSGSGWLMKSPACKDLYFSLLSFAGYAYFGSNNMQLLLAVAAETVIIIFGFPISWKNNVFLLLA